MGIPPILFAFVAPFGFACLDALCAFMINVVGMSLFQVMCFRNTLASSVLLPYLFTTDTPHAPLGPPGVRLLLWARGLAVALEVILIYSSMRYLTISEFWMVNSCVPFPAAILCRVILGEKGFTRVQGVCCVLSIAGVMMITNPFGPYLYPGSWAADDQLPVDPLNKLLGIGIALASIIVFGLEVVVMRLTGDRIQHPQILTTLAITPAAVSGILLIAGRLHLTWPDSPTRWVLLCATVPFGWLGQYSLTKAAHQLSGVTMIMTTYTGAGRLSDHHYPTVAPADCPQLIHSTAIQWFAYGTYPSITTTLGMVIIVGAGVVSALYGQRDPKSEEADVSSGQGSGNEEAGTPPEDHVPLLQEQLAESGRDHEE